MVLKVEGMHCDHCVAAVTRALAAVPGVVRVVRCDPSTGEVVVEGHPDPKTLVEAVEEEGYTARVLQP